MDTSLYIVILFIKLDSRLSFTIRVAFVTTFSPHFNVGFFIEVYNFGVTFWNKFEKGDCSFVFRVGATTIIEQIDPFPLYLHFVVTHSIHSFIQRENLQELGTIEHVVTGIYGKSSKSFILIVVDGLGPNDT
jgi:hypothetical protein